MAKGRRSSGRAPRDRHGVEMLYDGWAGEGGVPTLTPAEAVAPAFWAAHVAARRPAVVDGLPGEGWGVRRWTDDYLERVAGDAAVKVEVAPEEDARGESEDEGGAGPPAAPGPTKHPFGHGRSKSTTFGDVLRTAASGSEALYLTTQELDKAGKNKEWALEEGAAAAGEDGEAGGKKGGACGAGVESAPFSAPPVDGALQFGTPRSLPASLPALFAEPVASLLGDLPVVPAPFAGLCPQSINVWMGRTRAGTSSGLHHDFHDNLYVLVRGRKRFRLFPPSAAPAMALRGELRRVHPNGRPVYDGRGWRDVRADGSDGKVADAWVRRWEAEEEVRAAEREVAAAADGGAAKGGNRAGGGLDAGRGAKRGRRGPGAAGAGERLSRARCALADAVAATEDLEDEELLEEALGGGGEDGDGDGWDDLRDDFDDLEAQESSGPSVPVPSSITEPTPPPPSFSRVDPAWSAARVRRECPDFPGWDRALSVTIEAGQCLYLPAGWFHEVTSYSTPEHPVHLAVNYWFHPPDQARQGGRERPYASPYWEGVWAARRSGVLAMQARARHMASEKAPESRGERGNAPKSAPAEPPRSGDRRTGAQRDASSAALGCPLSAPAAAPPRLERFKRDAKASRSHVIAVRRSARAARAARSGKRPLPEFTPEAEELLRALLSSGAQVAQKKRGGRISARMFCLGRRRFLMG